MLVSTVGWPRLVLDEDDGVAATTEATRAKYKQLGLLKQTWDSIMPDPNGGMVFEKREHRTIQYPVAGEIDRMDHIVHVWADGTATRFVCCGGRVLSEEKV